MNPNKILARATVTLERAILEYMPKELHESYIRLLHTLIDGVKSDGKVEGAKKLQQCLEDYRNETKGV